MTRLDAALVDRGLARSRGQARELVTAGRVRVGGTPARKPAHPVSPDDDITVDGGVDHYVGRAAHKLLAALDAFPVDVTGRRCIDVGASTGGFTQVLLEHGAASVCALDVGHGQLAAVLVDDPRVDDRSGTTVRGIDPAAVGGPFDVLVTDLSFISLTLVAPELRALVHDGADLVLLVKPQFEVGRGGLGKNGVVRDPDRRTDAVETVLTCLRDHGIHPRAVAPSPLRGSDGNVEVLLWATTGASPTATDLTGAVRAATRDPDERRAAGVAPVRPVETARSQEETR